MIALVTIPNREAPIDLYTQYMPLKTRRYQNLESAKTRGLDLTLRYAPAPEWQVGAAYSYLDTDAQVYDTEHDVLQNVVIDGMAHHKGSWFATWNHALKQGATARTANLGLGLYGRMSSKRYYQLNGNGKGYHTWRLTAHYDFTWRGARQRSHLCRIEAGADNLLNYCDRTPHGLHLGTTTPGRTVYAALTVQLNQGSKLSNHYKKSNLNNNYQNEQD